MSENRQADALTIAAIAVVAGALGTVLHEALGHGGACLVTGGHVLVVSTVHEECTIGNFWVDAGGTLVNLVAGVLAWGLLARVTRSTPWRMFLWLFMTINLLQVGGYWLFSGIANLGDWADILAGHQPAWLWHTLITIAGIVAYYACVRLSMHELEPLVGPDDGGRAQRARQICFIAYFTYGILSCVAGLFNPVGPLLIAISAAAASFGGVSGLLWGWQFLGRPRQHAPAIEFPPLARSKPWIAAAAVIAVLFIAFLGRGLHF